MLAKNLLSPDEEIILVVRRHWFNILYQMIPAFIMIGFLFAAHRYLPDFFPAISKEPLRGLFMLAENFFAMAIWLILFLIWIDYYFDVSVVTTRRIIDINQRGLFFRDISELKLERIQDITADVRGVIPTMLNYGDVLIQTAAEVGRFNFEKVPDPYAIKDLLMNLQQKEIKEETNELGEMIRKKIRDELKEN